MNVLLTFANMVKLRILREGDDPGSSGWAQCHHKRPQKGKRKTGESKWERM